MTDIQLKTIFPRKPSRLTSLAFYQNGRWQFGSLGNTAFVSDSDQKIYRIGVKFSLVSENENDPSRGLIIGQPGDYVGVDRLGTFSLITKEQYNYRFPKKSKPTYTAETSETLRDPNYITEIVRGSAATTSNTTPRTTYTPSTSRSSGGSGGGTYGGSSGGSSGGGGGGGY